MSGAAGWVVLALGLAFTVVCIVLACAMNADDLAAAQHDLEVDELWLDGDEWVEPA